MFTPLDFIGHCNYIILKITTCIFLIKGVIHQLDVAMEDTATQRGGLVFVYNMYGSKYANFDYDLSQKMLTLLKGLLTSRLCSSPCTLKNID